MTRVLRPDVHPPPHPDVLKRLARLEKGLHGIAADGVSYFLGIGNVTIFTGAGAPSAAIGADGDYYFRQDTPGTANQRIYVHSAGTWTGVL
jgi:hypothetical protein